jgi:hypothetical protein
MATMTAMMALVAMATVAARSGRAITSAATMTSNSNAVGADHRDSNNCDQDRNTSKKSTIHEKPPKKTSEQQQIRVGARTSDPLSAGKRHSVQPQGKGRVPGIAHPVSFDDYANLRNCTDYEGIYLAQRRCQAVAIKYTDRVVWLKCSSIKTLLLKTSHFAAIFAV